jgi:hypothetical protein
MIALPTVSQVFDGTCFSDRLETSCPQYPLRIGILLPYYWQKASALSSHMFLRCCDGRVATGGAACRNESMLITRSILRKHFVLVVTRYS